MAEQQLYPFTRLLLIDDDVDFADAQAEFLESRGYEVAIAHNKEAVAEVSATFQPTIALIDLHLGHDGGIEILELLHSKFPSVICILVTGRADIDSAVTALRHGAADYLSKAVAPDELVRVLERNLERQRLLLEREKMRTAQREDAAVNAALKQELAARQVIEQELKEHKENLQGLVEQRTAELRTSQERLNQATKMQALGTLAGGIAHDFNNILTAISGFADLSLRASAPGSEVHGHVTRIFAASQRATDLVKQILTFSRQSGEYKEIVSLQAVSEETLGLLQQTLPSTLEIHLSFRASNSNVYADPTQMQQILLNLCSNSAQAVGAQPGNLWVSLDDCKNHKQRQLSAGQLEPGRYVRLTVRDDGCGLAGESVLQIFEPFFTTSEVGEGIGMGLAVVHSIVAAHGGAIDVDSAPGQGATFQVYLPHTNDQPQQSAQREITLGQSTGKILLVDDEDMILRFYRTVLDGEGYDIVCCHGGMEALEALNLDPQAVDLVITDETMPHMTGMGLIEAIKKVRSDLPILLCSGNASLVPEVVCRELGINGFLVKPVLMDVLLQEVDRLISP